MLASATPKQLEARLDTYLDELWKGGVLRNGTARVVTAGAVGTVVEQVSRVYSDPGRAPFGPKYQDAMAFLEREPKRSHHAKPPVSAPSRPARRSQRSSSRRLPLRTAAHCTATNRTAPSCCHSCHSRHSRRAVGVFIVVGV